MSYPTDTAEPREGMAIGSIILGLLSLLCFGPITGVPAIILGAIALSQAKRNPGEYGGEPIAKWGIGTGIASCVMLLIYIVVTAIIAAAATGADAAAAKYAKSSTYAPSHTGGELRPERSYSPSSPSPTNSNGEIFTTPSTPSTPFPAPTPSVTPVPPPPARLRLSFDSIDQAIKVLPDGQPEERRAALSYISREDVDETFRKQVANELERFLQMPEYRDLAMVALAKWMTRENVPAVRLMLENLVHPDYSGGGLDGETAVAKAITALGEHNDVNAAPTIALCLKSAMLRSAASKALVNFGSGAADSVELILKTNDAATAQEACKVLKTIGTEKNIPALQKIMFDRSNQAAKAAQDAVQEIATRNKIDPAKYFSTLIDHYTVPAPFGFVADKNATPNTRQWSRTAPGRAIKSVYTVHVAPVDPASPVNIAVANPTVDTEKGITFRQKSMTKSQDGLTATAEWVAVDGDNVIEVTVVGDAFDKKGQEALFTAVKKIAAKEPETK